MATEPVAKANRTPWIIAGVLGCLVLCLLLALIGVSAYFVFGTPGFTNPGARVAPTIILTMPSPPATATAFALPTLPLIVPSPTLGNPPALPTPLPSVPSATLRPPGVTPTRVIAPTGKIAFSRCEDVCDINEKKSIWVMNADGSNAHKILDLASDPAISPDGTRIAYYHWTDGMYLASIDGTNSRKWVGDTKARNPAWSHDGRQIAFNGIDAVPSSVLPGETPPRRPIVLRGGSSPSWSPDDNVLVFQACRDNCGIFKANAAVGDPILVVADNGSLPSLSPNGRLILYQREVDGAPQLFQVGIDGLGIRQLTFGASMHVDAAWSLDGTAIFYRSPEDGGKWAIWRMNADGSNRIKIFDNAQPVDWAFEKLAVFR